MLIIRINFFVLLLLIVLSLKAFSQNENDCFNNIIPPWELSIPDSISITGIDKRYQEFYDELIKCKAPDFKVVTIDGDTIELNKLKGNVVVLYFWFVECSGCISKIHAINKLVEEYNAKDFIFIAMSRNSKTTLLRDFIPKDTLNSIIVPDCVEIATQYFVGGWPTTFVLNKKGKLVRAFMGSQIFDEKNRTSFYDTLKNIIDELL